MTTTCTLDQSSWDFLVGMLHKNLIDIPTSGSGAIYFHFVSQACLKNWDCDYTSLISCLDEGMNPQTQGQFIAKHYSLLKSIPLQETAIFAVSATVLAVGGVLAYKLLK